MGIELSKAHGDRVAIAIRRLRHLGDPTANASIVDVSGGKAIRIAISYKSAKTDRVALALDIIYSDKVLADGRVGMVRIVPVQLSGKALPGEYRNPVTNVEGFMKDLGRVTPFMPPNPFTTNTRETWVKAYGNVPGCPKCGHPLRRIETKDGNEFWGCSQWKATECKGSLDIDPDLGDGDFPPKCPDCAHSMRRRDGGRGYFWSCSAFPDCRRTLEDSEGHRSLTVIADWQPPPEDKVMEESDVKEDIVLADLSRRDLLVYASKKGVPVDPNWDKDQLISAIMDGDVIDEDPFAVFKPAKPADPVPPSAASKAAPVAGPEPEPDTVDAMRNRWRKRS